MDSPSSIEVPRPVGKGIFTHHVIQPASKLDIWRIIVKSHARVARVRRRASEGESRASGTRKETREPG